MNHAELLCQSPRIKKWSLKQQKESAHMKQFNDQDELGENNNSQRNHTVVN